MSIIKFLDSTSNKRKSLIFPAGEDDIIINLPKDSGILATDRLAEKKLRENDSDYDRNVIFILKPDIKENNGGVTTTGWDGYFKIASFRVSNGYLGKHTGTEWVAYSDERLTTLVDKSSDDLNKEMWKPNTNIPNLKLYVRYRFVSNSIYSPWSDSIITTTSSGGISPFDVSVEENTLTPGCLISGFKTYGDAIGATHTATTWVVYESIDGKLGNKVFDSGKDSTNKISFTIPNGVLKGDLEYSLQVTLHTNNAKYANSIPYIRKFTTIGAYIHRPVLQYKPTKDNQHKIIASEYVSTARNETLVSAIWSLYDADDNRLINTVTNTSSEYDITPFISNNKKYYVTLVYKSNTLTSKEGKCTFNANGNKAEPIVATFTTSDKKLPILNLSKFYVPGQTDEIKGFAFRIERNMLLHPRKYNRRENWFNGKYNEPMTHTFEVSDFSGFASPGEVWTNEPIKLKGYIIGNKYNSDIFEATFTPSIDLNYKVEHIGDDWSNLKFKISLDNTLDPVNFTPDWVGIIVAQCYRPQEAVPVNGYKEYGTNNYIINASSYGYEYNKDYTFTFKIYTSIGAKFIDYTLQMERGIISDPTMEITAVHGYGNYVNMKVKGSEYGYSKPIDNTNGLKEIKLTIQDTTDNNQVVYEKIQTVDDKGPAVYNFDINYDKNHLDKSLKHNTKYLVSIEYKNNRDERSKRVSKEFTTIERDAIIWPEYNLFVTYDTGVNEINRKNIPCIKYIYVNTGNNIYNSFSTYNINKIVYRIKKENGELVDELVVTPELYKSIPQNNILHINNYKRLIKSGRLEYNWETLITSQWLKDGSLYQNELFKFGEVYTAEIECYKEDASKAYTCIFIPYYNIGITNTVNIKKNNLDNLRLRNEYILKIEIPEPTLPINTILTNEQISKIILNISGILSPNITLKKIETFIGYSSITNSLKITTNMLNTDEPGEISVKAFDNPYIDPTFTEGKNDLPSYKVSDTSILTYDKIKPIFYICNEENKWYLNIKYTLFPRELERDPEFIFPFDYRYKNFSFITKFYYQYNDNKTEFVQNTTIKDPQNSLGILTWGIPPREISQIGKVIDAYNDDAYTTMCVTTDKFIERKIELSKVRSYKYDILIFVNYYYKDYMHSGNIGGKFKYSLPYLEYIPINGCKLILSFATVDLITSPVSENDNLLIQPNKNNGVHYKFYKVNPDGSETYVPGIEDAFSVGVSTRYDKELSEKYTAFGRWTKPVNTRNVLEHGQIYKLKIWFTPYNNEAMGRALYYEKHFVAYDSSKGDVMEPKDQVGALNGISTRYNRLMEKFISTTVYPHDVVAGENYGIAIFDMDTIATDSGIQGIDSDPTVLTETLMFNNNLCKIKNYFPVLFCYMDLNDIRYLEKTSVAKLIQNNDLLSWGHNSKPITISNIWTDANGKEHYYSKAVTSNTIFKDFFIINPSQIKTDRHKNTYELSILNGEILGNYFGFSSRENRLENEHFENYYLNRTPLLDRKCNFDLNLNAEYLVPTKNLPIKTYPNQQTSIQPVPGYETKRIIAGTQKDNIGNIICGLPRQSDLYAPGALLPNNMVSHSDFTIGEQHITAIGKGEMKLDKPSNNTDNQIKFKAVKNVPDWIKDTANTK